MPSFIAGKRLWIAAVAVAGTLTLVAAVSAAVVMSPPGAAAGSAGAASDNLMTAGHQHDGTRAARTQGISEARLLDGFYKVRIAAGERQHRHEAAVAKAAAAKAAAHRAAAAKAAEAAAARAAATQAAAGPTTAPQAAPATQPQPAPQAAPATQPQPAPAPSGSPQRIAEQMLGQFGWSSSQFSCLEPLWQRESGWNVYAENPSSGAYGIPQALPGSQMASAGADWRTSAATQIRWGLTYIESRYGTPCAALAHEQADGWY